MTLIHGERSVTFCAEVQDPSGTRMVPLPRGCFQVGSGRHCAIVVADAAVSAEHLVLVIDDERVVVRDTGSKNGTFIGSVRVREASAAVGAVVTLGRSTIALCATDDTPDTLDADPLPTLAGGSLAMRRVAAQVRRLAPLRYPVLVTGESGTGKELVAHALHALSPRKHKPFIAINVTSVPRELIESEFFGHERGSFTGATARRRGAFEDAEGGTLFLDEIGDLPRDAQPKLLRALDGYGIRSVGATGTAARHDVRVIAATHATLRDRVSTGDFRRDLFHRLEVFTVALPPLRERQSDIGPIARALLRSMAPDVGPKELTSAALARLVSESWPGNVRELRNVLVRAAARARGDVIESCDVDAAIGSRTIPYDVKKSEVTPEIARIMVREHRGNISAAARTAGFPRTTFRKLLAK
jgi:DNA-binding NtrC family response regulator